MSTAGQDRRCGFVSVTGLPNAGKSTLVNRLVGAKVAIVSAKPHTTRNRIAGIALHENAQIILIDAPGILAGSGNIKQAMQGVALGALAEGESVIHLVDASGRAPLDNNRALLEKLPRDKPAVLVLNKTDKSKKPPLLALSGGFNTAFPYAATFMVSALHGEGTGDLLAHLARSVPPGPWLFARDQITDSPARLLAAEITREQIFNRLRQELPYAVTVHTESWQRFDNGSIRIDQAVVVQRDTQKAIVLGKGGRSIQQIGRAAREELEKIFRARIHLKLFVKVEKQRAGCGENARSAD